MEHDDPARGACWARPAHDRGDRPFLPVSGVEVRQDDQVPAFGAASEGDLLGDGDGVTRGGVGRSDEAGVTARRADNGRLGQLQLQTALPLGAIRHRDVREGVVADLVPVLSELAHDARVPGDLTADDEERGVDVRGPQDVRDLWRPAWIGSVVERQSDAASRWWLT